MYPYNLQNNNKKKNDVAEKEVMNKMSEQMGMDDAINMNNHMKGHSKMNMNDHMNMHDPMNMNDPMNRHDSTDMDDNMNMNNPVNMNDHMNMNASMNMNNHQVDEKILELIKEGMQDEVNDAEYYRKMQSLFQNEEDKNTIRRIGLDEKKHKKMLDQMYTMLSGKEPPIIKPGHIEVTRNVLAELNKRIVEELEGVEYYRRLHSLLEGTELRDMAFEMMVDENIHAIKLTHLYSKYK